MPRRDLIFRVFVSSTFSDFIAERNALQKHTFPNLAHYCQQKGARFQAIDLRWGVSEEAALDQQTMNICLQELQRCQRVSPRPNFIILLGDRYGWRPLPPQIDAAEFEQLMERVKVNNRPLLNQWYKRDDNAVPPEYCLRCRNPSACDGLSENEYREAIRKEAEIWNKTEPQLHSLLLEAAQTLFQPGDSKLQKYEESATHQEIRSGAFQTDNPHSHVFAYFRKIEGLPTNDCAKDYRDIDVGKGTVDEDAYNRLKVLKEELRSLLSPNHDCEDIITHWQVNQEGVKPEERISHNHLNDFCERVEKNLLKIIDREIGDFKVIAELDREIEAHKTFSEQRTRCFIGRKNVLWKIHSYLSDSSNEPLVLYGVSGCGKTALMAKANDLAIQAQESDRVKGFKINVISRFIGATPESTDIRLLLASLSKQLSDVYHDEKPVPTDYQELLKNFSRLLHLSSLDKPLIILLDAIDQLSDSYQGELGWLPYKLPEHVKIIVSLIPIESYFLHLKKHISVQNLLELQTMPIEEGCALLDLWLKEAKRSLSSPQYDQIKTRFVVCGLPLYLKLAFEEARRWKSYTEPGQTVLNADVAGVFKDILDRFCLPVNHGKVIVSRSMGYLLAAKNGLTEDEMISVLSCDENVVGDFIKRSHPDHEISEFRLPVVLWSRLYFDLEPYMAMRTADGTTVLAFFHRQLQTVAEEKFLQNSRRDRHVALADYFDGILEKEKNRDRISDRRVVSELPYHLIRGRKFKMLDKLLCDPHFLTAAAKLGYTYTLPDDLGLKLEKLSTDIPSDSLTAIVLKSWVKQLSVLESNPDIAFQTLYNDIALTGDSEKHSFILRKWHDWAMQHTLPYTCIWALMKYTYPKETQEDFQFVTYAPVSNNELSQDHIINICGDSLLTKALCLKTCHEQSYGKLPFRSIKPVYLSPDGCKMLIRTAENSLEGRETISVHVISNNGFILFSITGCDADNDICGFLDSSHILISRNWKLEAVNIIEGNTVETIPTPDLIPRLCCIAPDSAWFAMVFDVISGDKQKLSIYKWGNQHADEIEIPYHILSIKYLFINVVGWRDVTETITIYDIIEGKILLVREQPCSDFDFDRSNNRLYWIDSYTNSFKWCNLAHEAYHEPQLKCPPLIFLRLVGRSLYLGSLNSVFRLDSNNLDKYTSTDAKENAHRLAVSAVGKNAIVTADYNEVFIARPGFSNTAIATSHHVIKNLHVNETGDSILIQDSSGDLSIRDLDGQILSSFNEETLNRIKWHNNRLFGITQNRRWIKFIESNGKEVRHWPNRIILPQGGKVNRSSESVGNFIVDIEIRHKESKEKASPKNKLLGLNKFFKTMKAPGNPVVDCAVLITHNGKSFVQIHTLNILGQSIDDRTVPQIPCAAQPGEIKLMWPFLFIEFQKDIQVYNRLPESGPIEKHFLSRESRIPTAIFHKNDCLFYMTKDNNHIIFYPLEPGDSLGRLLVSHISQIHMYEEGILELKDTASHSFFELIF